MPSAALWWVPVGHLETPPLPGAEELFFELKDSQPRQLDEPLLLLCRVLVSGGSFDTLAEPDLTMDLSVAGGPTSTHDGSMNSSVGYVSVHLPRIASGDLLHLRVQDLDITTVEYIGETEAKFTGAFPLELETRYITATCRARETSSLEPRMRSALVDADRELKQLDNARPVARRPMWGFPSDRMTAVRGALSQAAAYVGWRHPEVSGRLSRLYAFETGFGRAAQQGIDKLKVAAGEPGAPVTRSSLTLTVTDVTCRPSILSIYTPQPPLQDEQGRLAFEPSTCRIELTVTAVAQPVVLDPDKRRIGPFGSAQAVARNGATAELVFDELSCAATNETTGSLPLVELAAGQSCRVTLTDGNNGPLPARPVLLVLTPGVGEPLLLSL